MGVVTENISGDEISITDDFRWNLLQRKAAEVRAAAAFAIFREHGIEPVLIKGTIVLLAARGLWSTQLAFFSKRSLQIQTLGLPAKNWAFPFAERAVPDSQGSRSADSISS